jgi:predicted nucleic acid-binding protein
LGAKLLVLDANILIRAVLGKRVRALLVRYGGTVQFFAPDYAFEEAREHLPEILPKRNIPIEEGLAVLNSLSNIVRVVGIEAYSAYRQQAQRRLIGRDEQDWPILAAAMFLDCPIWTEDTDFFGAGVATWTSDRIELFFQSASTS